MTTSRAKGSYSDCFDLFDRALASPIGIRYRVSSRGKAYHLRTRLNYARTLNRAEAAEVYAPDSPNYAVSPYDPLVVRIHEDRDGWWVYIEPVAISGEIEELKAAE